ncbi:helix-turn-helix domain-containing protein [Phaeacidiphilus oryzae]|uniref:helix-turn-helix domain-containing protein n=1 Tax=Phaeacidiphilus oryzae TaxID=348818 RepID=UPI00068F0667
MLELLAGGAPAEDLAAAVAEARAAAEASAGPAGAGRIDEAGRLALAVHRTLRQHRRREAELTALFETAGDLAAQRDLDAVLKAIVRRARALLGTDTAYLTMPDEEAGDTYMRVTDGSVSALFQTLHLNLGEGLGGLVAQTARPYATRDYRHDARFHHTRLIDAGVLDEGLIAILGVPLLLGASSGSGQVIGVLFAADRSPRHFSPDEVALLNSLAAHAAIAIDSARVAEATRAAYAELAEAHGVIREHAADVQRAEESHDRLTDLVLGGGELPELAAAVAGLLGGPISVHGPEGRTLARCGNAGSAVGSAAGWDPAAVAAAVAESRRAGRSVPCGGGWVCAVTAGQELLGSLALRGRPELAGADRRLFERAGMVTGLLLLVRRSVAEAENRVRGELLSDLLTDPGRDPAGLVERARRLGVELERPQLVLAARCPDEARAGLAAAAVQYLFGRRGGISARHGGDVVLLLPPERGVAPGEAARRAAERLAAQAGAPVTVGAAAEPASGPAALAAAYEEAARCAGALEALGRAGDGACAGELGFLGVLLGDGQSPARAAGFVRSALGPLLDYDERRGTELVRTLEAYFECGTSLVRAKDELHVHVNTVVQRLDRIASLLGEDWNSPARALELQLALRLRALAPNTPG